MTTKAVSVVTILTNIFITIGAILVVIGLLSKNWWQFASGACLYFANVLNRILARINEVKEPTHD